MHAVTHASREFLTIVQREGGLQKTLSAAKLSMIAIGGAIGTGLFLGSGFAVGTAGPGVLISYAIGALIALLLMGCLAEMTIAHPTTGSFGAYAEYYIGPLAVTLALMLAVIPWTQAGSTQSPFVRVMQVSRLPAAGGVMNFVVLIAALSAMNSQLYITTRMMFSLSRAGHAPRSLGHLSGRGVPLNALLTSTCGIALATVLTVISPGGAFLTMLGISAFGAMFTWMMIFVTHFLFRRASANAPASFRVWGFPATPLLGAALMAALLITTAFTDAFRSTLVFGLPFLAALVLLYYFRYRPAVRDLTTL